MHTIWVRKCGQYKKQDLSDTKSHRAIEKERFLGKIFRGRLERMSWMGLSRGIRIFWVDNFRGETGRRDSKPDFHLRLGNVNRSKQIPRQVDAVMGTASGPL